MYKEYKLYFYINIQIYFKDFLQVENSQHIKLNENVALNIVHSDDVILHNTDIY